MKQFTFIVYLSDEHADSLVKGAKRLGMTEGELVCSVSRLLAAELRHGQDSIRSNDLAEQLAYYKKELQKEKESGTLNITTELRNRETIDLYVKRVDTDGNYIFDKLGSMRLDNEN